MTTRPTDPTPEWASSGTRTTPSASKRILGWIFQEPVPFDWLNWWLYTAWIWLEHFATSASRWATLHQAVEGMAIGDTAIVDEYDGASYPGEELLAIASGGNLWSSVDVSGDGVFYADNSLIPPAPVGVKRSDLTTQYGALAYIGPGNPISRLVCDGRYVVVAAVGNVYVWDAQAGGAALWTYAHGGQINDIAIDGTHVYLVGDPGGGGFTARAVLLATGALVWSYDHGAALESVATDGRRVFIGGAASSHASAATIRCLVASNGYDAANEGSTGLDTTDTAWDQAYPSPPARYGQLATDGRGLLVVGRSGGANRIATLSTGDGGVLALGGVPNPYVPPVAVDDRWIYSQHLGLGTLGRVVAYSKDTLQPVWVSETDAQLNYMISDGAAIFLTASTGSPQQLIKLARGNGPRIWRRVDPADDHLVLRQLIVPGD